MDFYKENWFRWIAILPGSALAYLAVMFPIHWIVMFIFYSGTHDNDFGGATSLSLWYWLAKIQPENLELLFSSFFCPLILIVVSSKIAPKYKMAISTLIAIGIFILDAYMSLEFINDLQSGRNEAFEWFRIFLTMVLAITGILLGLRSAFKENKRIK